MNKEQIEFQSRVLDRLPGKIFLLQDADQRREAIYQTFLEVYGSGVYHLPHGGGSSELESFFNEFLQYGIIEEFLTGHDVEDIIINSLYPIFIHKTSAGMIQTDKRFSSFAELNLFIKKLVFFSGRASVQKVNNVELMGVKGRANIIFSPLGPQITITHAKEEPLSIIDLVKSGTLNSEMAAHFWLYVEGLGIKPANLMISGGPGAGKTTLLNALLSFIPSNDRIVLIEDTFELNTRDEENIARLETDDELNLADLVKNSLRMRPDRILIGEVRGVEAQDLMTAMNIGKYCMCTIHASTARETILRLQNEPMNVPEVLVNLIDVFVIMRKVMVNGTIHRVVGELVETAGMEKMQVLLSFLWTCDLSTLEFCPSAVSSTMRDKIAQMSGLTSQEIMFELAVRTRIMEHLVNQNIRSMKDISAFCRVYAQSPEKALSSIGLTRESLLTIRDSRKQKSSSTSPGNSPRWNPYL